MVNSFRSAEVEGGCRGDACVACRTPLRRAGLEKIAGYRRNRPIVR